jgi:hypothetical protein
MTWRTSVSQTATTARITNISQYLQSGAGSPQSPIDAFYAATQQVLAVGTPALLTAQPDLGALLLVGIVSATENYFRDLFARAVTLCPIARAAASEETIRLGSVLWHGADDAVRGAFEQMSFASSKNVRETAKKFLDYQMRLSPALVEFDKVCELRHGIVHSQSVLGGKNALKLQVNPSATRLKIAIGFSELQEAASICTSLVISINTELFGVFAKRWAKEWPQLPSWVASERHSSFKSLWKAFYSSRDAGSGAIPTPLSLTKARNAIAKEFK